MSTSSVLDQNSVRSASTGSPPPARRLPRMRWRDARLWLGVALMGVAMFAGARLLGGGQDTAVVWRATRDLPAGAVPVAEPIEVSLGEAASAYLPASASLDGRLRLPVPAGALIPADALGMAPQAGTRLVTLAIDPLHAPVGLAAGDVVDIWATGVDGASTIIEAPQLVLPEVQVVQVDGENLGVGGEMAVVVEVPQASAPDLVRSTRSRVLDLVAVPLQAMTPGKQS